MGSLFGGGGSDPAPQPTPEEIARDRIQEERDEIFGINRQRRAQADRRGARSLLVSTGLGVPGLNSNSGG